MHHPQPDRQTEQQARARQPPRQPASLHQPTRAFPQLTGYALDEVIGRNCCFLQGPGTNAETIATLRRALADRTDIPIKVLNDRGMNGIRLATERAAERRLHGPRRRSC